MAAQQRALRVNGRVAKMKLRVETNNLPSGASVELTDLLLQPGNTPSGWLPHVTELPWTAGVSEETAVYPSTNLTAINSRVSDVENAQSSMGSEIEDLDTRLSPLESDVPSSFQRLNTARPDSIDPWIDLRSYLINGWTSIGSQTFGMAVMPNSLMVSARLVADESTSRIFAEGLPFVGPQNLPIAAALNGVPISIELQRSTGRFYITGDYLDVPREGELVISGIIARGTQP